MLLHDLHYLFIPLILLALGKVALDKEEFSFKDTLLPSALFIASGIFHNAFVYDQIVGYLAEFALIFIFVSQAIVNSIVCKFCFDTSVGRAAGIGTALFVTHFLLSWGFVLLFPIR